jgi:hypothetical protein
MKIKEKFIKLLKNYLGIVGIEVIFNDITPYTGSSTNIYWNALFVVVLVEVLSFNRNNKETEAHRK